MLITYPLLTVVDDSGAVVSGATVTVASVTDKAGVAVASPGATLNQAGPNVSVDYDAEAHAEAWVTLAISKSGSTFSGVNAAPSFFLSRDPSRIESGISAAGKVTPDGSRVPAVRNLDAVTAPTVDDCLVAAFAEAAGKGTQSATGYVLTKPDNSGPLRTLVLQRDTNGNVTSWG